MKKHRNNINVLFPYAGDTFGGSHVSSIALASSLQKVDGINVLLAVHNPGALEDFLSKISLPYLSVPRVELVKPGGHFKEFIGMVTAAWKLTKFLKANEIDIVHTNDIRMHLTWLLASRLAGSKLVWHQRTASRNKKLGYYAALASQVLAVSAYCKETLPDRMSKSANIIYDPVVPYLKEFDKHKYKARLLKEIGANEDAVIVSWVANWTRQKRPLDFVKCASYVLSRTKLPIYFLMFGEARDPVASEVNSLIDSLDLSDAILPMGVKTPIEPYLLGSDLLLATAVNEGLGRTLIEALLCQTPVIATNDGGHKEVIFDKKNGVLVPAEDPVAMGEAVLSFIRKPNGFITMSKEAVRPAMDKYSVNSHVCKILEVYKKL